MVDVLVVCTANVARSPLLAVRLGWEAERRLGGQRVEVGSSGTSALYGQAAAPGSRKVAVSWGLTLEEHRATPVTHHDLASIPLVLTMEIGQRRDVAGRAPGIESRCFTVPELVTIVSDRLDPRDVASLPHPTSGPHDRIAAVATLAHAHRPRWLTRRRGEVPDPLGADEATYDALGERFADAAATLGEVLFGPVRG
jgi:protein-tyrosine-phosphatase